MSTLTLPCAHARILASKCQVPLMNFLLNSEDIISAPISHAILILCSHLYVLLQNAFHLMFLIHFLHLVFALWIHNWNHILLAKGISCSGSSWIIVETGKWKSLIFHHLSSAFVFLCNIRRFLFAFFFGVCKLKTLFFARGLYLFNFLKFTMQKPSTCPANFIGFRFKCLYPSECSSWG